MRGLFYFVLSNNMDNNNNTETTELDPQTLANRFNLVLQNGVNLSEYRGNAKMTLYKQPTVSVPLMKHWAVGFALQTGDEVIFEVTGKGRDPTEDSDIIECEELADSQGFLFHAKAGLAVTLNTEEDRVFWKDHGDVHFNYGLILRWCLRHIFESQYDVLWRSCQNFAKDLVTALGKSTDMWDMTATETATFLAKCLGVVILAYGVHRATKPTK